MLIHNITDITQPRGFPIRVMGRNLAPGKSAPVPPEVYQRLKKKLDRLIGAGFVFIGEEAPARVRKLRRLKRMPHEPVVEAVEEGELISETRAAELEKAARVEEVYDGDVPAAVHKAALVHLLKDPPKEVLKRHLKAACRLVDLDPIGNKRTLADMLGRVVLGNDDLPWAKLREALGLKE